MSPFFDDGVFGDDGVGSRYGLGGWLGTPLLARALIGGAIPRRTVLGCELAARGILIAPILAWWRVLGPFLARTFLGAEVLRLVLEGGFFERTVCIGTKRWCGMLQCTAPSTLQARSSTQQRTTATCLPMQC